VRTSTEAKVNRNPLLGGSLAVHCRPLWQSAVPTAKSRRTPGDQPQARSPSPASSDGAPEVLFPMKMRPLHDRILVKRVEEEAKTKGGIIIPDTAKEKPQEAKVVAVGSGKVTDDGKLVALEVKKGDRVLFGKYSGSEVQIDGEEHLIIREEDVLAIIE
jgi:chaperonin GroES